MYHNVMKPHNAMQSLVMTAKMRPRVKQDSAGIPEQFWLILPRLMWLTAGFKPDRFAGWKSSAL